MERYVLNTDRETMEEIFGVRSNSSAILEPTFNAAPGHSLPIIFSNAGKLVLESAIWGIKIRSSSISSLDIDDVLANKKYRPLLRTNACIIPVTGFYKWKQTVDDPLPFLIRIHTRELLGIAGFYLENEDFRNNFCAITKAANVLIKPLDNTMPCIINPQDTNSWLRGGAEEILNAGFKDISLLPEMTTVRVPDLVNDLSNNSPDLVQPIPKLRDED
ncbi:MAG: SOS response-associated peptidase [Balneolaceae bacterium]